MFLINRNAAVATAVMVTVVVAAVSFNLLPVANSFVVSSPSVVSLSFADHYRNYCHERSSSIIRTTAAAGWWKKRTQPYRRYRHIYQTRRGQTGITRLRNIYDDGSSDGGNLIGDDDENDSINGTVTTTTTTLEATTTESYFGVGEKTLEFRGLVEASTMADEEDIDTCVPSEDFIDVAVVSPPIECPVTDTTTTTTTAMSSSSSSLRPKTILKFISPTLALWIAPPTMSLIDTSVVGRFCSPLDLAALNPGCTLIDSSSYLFMFLATAATNMVASVRATTTDDAGRDNKSNNLDSNVDRIVSEALFLALCCGIGVTSIVLIAGRPLLLAIAGSASKGVVPAALRYSLIRSFGQPFVIMASVARAASLASKDTQGPLLSVLLAFVLNAIGTLTLVKYTNLGIMGAAIGTLGADICATLFLLKRLQQSRISINKQQQNNIKVEPTTTTKPSPLLAIPTLDNFKMFLQYAAPIFFTILGKSVVWNGIAVSVGRMGSIALAAHQVLYNNFLFWTPIGDSVGMTSQVFLPGILAEERTTKQPKRGAKRLLFSIGVLAGLIAGSMAGLLPSQGSRLFTTSADVTTALQRTAPILTLCVSMHAIATTCEGMLLAQRDLKFLSNSYVLTTVITSIWLLSPFRPSNLAGSWWILAIFQGSRAIQFALRTLWISRRREIQKGLV